MKIPMLRTRQPHTAGGSVYAPARGDWGNKVSKAITKDILFVPTILLQDLFLGKKSDMKRYVIIRLLIGLLIILNQLKL